MLNYSAFAILFFLLLALLEFFLSPKIYTRGSLAMNMAIGGIDQIVSLFGFYLLFLSLSFVYDNFRIYTFADTWLQWALAYLAVDFVSYWYHRLSHQVNFLWAGHITHHSSSHFNFSNSFRTSPFQGINRILFWPILPLLGFSPLVLILTLKISGIIEFFQHSHHVPKLGILEKIFVTPSIHRVHHGKNELYLDKNYGSTFLIWDQLFGTYQAETEPVVYGIKNPDYVDDNPVKAIFFHYTLLAKEMVSIPNWRDKLKILFMNPGWKYSSSSQSLSNKAPLRRTKTHQYTIDPRHYFNAVFQMVGCSIGIILLLIFKNQLSLWLLVGLSLSLISGICLAAPVFINRLVTGYLYVEIVRLLFSVLVLLYFYQETPIFYSYFLIFYLLTSVCLTAYAEQKIKTINLPITDY